jgi:hypothetical protein
MAQAPIAKRAFADFGAEEFNLVVSLLFPSFL